MNIVAANSKVSVLAIANAALKAATPEPSCGNEFTIAASDGVKLSLTTFWAASQTWHSRASKATVAIQNMVAMTSRILKSGLGYR